jgi:hypothetical protein
MFRYSVEKHDIARSQHFRPAIGGNGEFRVANKHTCMWVASHSANVCIQKMATRNLVVLCSPVLLPVFLFSAHNRCGFGMRRGDRGRGGPCWQGLVFSFRLWSLEILSASVSARPTQRESAWHRQHACQAKCEFARPSKRCPDLLAHSNRH